MTSTAIAPPIAGVAPQGETQVEYVFPGVACNGLGRLIGTAMGAAGSSGPAPLNILPLLIVGGILWPLGLVLYAWVKIFGSKYVVTNRSVQQFPVLGSALQKRVNHSDVANVRVAVQDGYEFHRVGDVQLLGANGDVLFSIPAVQYPDRLARLILELRDAQSYAAASLKQIQARK